MSVIKSIKNDVWCSFSTEPDSLHDLEVRNSNYNGINCDDGGDVTDNQAAHHLIFKNLYIHDIGGTGNQDGLKLSGINDFLVRPYLESVL